MKRFSLYMEFIMLSIRDATVYRSTFFAGVIGQWVSYGATFATLYILVFSFDTLAGWSPYEVLFLYALNLLSYGLGATFFYNMQHSMPADVRSGNFDQVLTKPLNPLVYYICSGFNTGYISHILLSLAVMVIALVKMKTAIGPASIILLVLLTVGASLIQAAMLLLSSILSFYFINQNPVADFLFWDMKNFINYPLNIYNKGIQLLLTFVLPYGFISYYPASLIFGMEQENAFSSKLGFLTLPLGIGLFCLAAILWNKSLKKYQGTGS